MNSRLRGVLILLMAGLVAIVVAYGISGLLQNARKAPTQRPEENEKVIVAAKDLPPGVTITTDDLRVREMPHNHVPTDVFLTSEEVVGRVASERILAGEFLREERLAAPEAGVGLPAIIPRGMRALQVPINGSSAVAGFVNPGNFVDVIAVCTETLPPEVRTLLQAVSVLAVNDRMVSLTYSQRGGGSRAGSRTMPSVTLALSPSDAELVKHAYSTCTITLTLRNDIDVTQVESNDRPPSEGAQGVLHHSTPAIDASRSRG